MRSRFVISMMILTALVACSHASVEAEGMANTSAAVEQNHAQQSPTQKPLPYNATTQEKQEAVGNWVEHARRENLRKKTPQEIEQMESALEKMEQRMKDNPESAKSPLMQQLAESLRRDISDAKRLQKESK